MRMDGGIIVSEIARVNIVILKSAAGLRNNAYPTATTWTCWWWKKKVGMISVCRNRRLGNFKCV